VQFQDSASPLLLNHQHAWSVLPALPLQGPEYLSTEKTRLEKVLSSGSVASSKAMEMAKKVSILKVLLGEADD